MVEYMAPSSRNAPLSNLFQSYSGPPPACSSTLVIAMGKQTLAILATMAQYDHATQGTISVCGIHQNELAAQGTSQT
jgi:hypothetical protein